MDRILSGIELFLDVVSLGFLRPVFGAFWMRWQTCPDLFLTACVAVDHRSVPISLFLPCSPKPVVLRAACTELRLVTCEPQICLFSNVILAGLSYQMFCTFLIENIVSSIRVVWVIIYVFLSGGVCLSSKIPTVFKEAPWWFLKLRHSITFRYQNQTRVCSVLK